MPSPSLSTPLIIFRHSSMEHSSPRLAITLCNSSTVMEPLPSMSKTENASFRFSRTSLGSMSFVLSSMNSSRLMYPSPSASTSRIMLSSSSSLAGCPRLFMMDPNSEDEILPSPLTSNFLKTCSSSATNSAREYSDGEREMIGVAVPAVATVVDDDDDFLMSFFLRLKRDLKPMILVGRKGPKENQRNSLFRG